MKTYSEMILLPSFTERFRYLKLGNKIGEDTFGFDRYLNQIFYKSKEWKRIRDEIIIRDKACDLAVDGHDIFGKILIHHLNPITQNDIKDRSDFLMNPEYLICTTLKTHNAIHYGDESFLQETIVERKKNDTIPWK